MVVAYRRTQRELLFERHGASLYCFHWPEPRYAVHGGVFKSGCGFLGSTFLIVTSASVQGLLA